MLTPNSIINKLFKYYLILFGTFFIIGWYYFPPFHNAFLQVLYCLLGYIICKNNIKLSVGGCVFSIFAFQLMCISLTAVINWEFYNDILGFNPQDALFYRECGEDFGDKSYILFFVWLYAIFPTIDDWGFPTIVWSLYHVFGGLGSVMLLLLNALAVAWGSYRLYGLSQYFVSKQQAKLIASIWGIMPYSVVVAAGGTKENFFGLIVIVFFYYLYRLYYHGGAGNILMVVLSAFGIFLFRLANGYAAIICILIISLIKKRFVLAHFKGLVVFGVIVSVIVFPLVLSLLIEQRGFDSDIFSSGNAAKAEEVGGTIGFVVNFISSLIGPIPCMISSDVDKLQHLTRYSFVPFIKILTSFFFYYALLSVYKRKRVIFMPLIIFVIINILMITVSFFGLHVKFQWPHMPIFILITFWGYMEYCKNHVKIAYYRIYIVAVMSLIFLYNVR